MALARVRSRYAGLGAYDPAEWKEYTETVIKRGQPWKPNARLEDPNGGIITFDSEGIQDTYQPPAAPAPNERTDNLPATLDPNGTFYGWTRYQQAAYMTAQGATGLITDKVRMAGVLQPGTNVLTYDPAVIAQNDAELRAFAQTDPKVRAALEQAKTGPFRGDAGQREYEENQAAAIENNARELLDGWLEFRASMIRQNPANVDMPLMPPDSYLGTALLPGVKDAIKRMVAGMPAPPKYVPPTAPVTTTLAPPTTTSSAPAPAPVNPPAGTTGSTGSGGSSPGPGTFTMPTPVLRDAPPMELYPDGSSFGSTTGPGGGWGGAAPRGGGGAAPAESGGFPWGLAALAGAAFLFFKPGRGGRRRR